MKDRIFLAACLLFLLAAAPPPTPPANGGTGINNGSNTLTLGGSLTTTGAATPTLAFGATGYTYTFPGANSDLGYLIGSAVNGDCVQFSGTAGGLADSGASCGGSPVTWPTLGDIVISPGVSGNPTGIVPGTGVAAALASAVTGSGGIVLATSPSVSGLTVTSSFTATGLVTLVDIATQATNTILANVTSGSASPTAVSVSSCSAAGDALIWTTNTGPGCNTSITAAAVPLSGITGLGTGVATALADNVGSAGAPVVFNGAGGTPSSLTLTNATGLPNASVAATPLPTPGSGATLAAPRSYYVCTTTCSVTLPTPAAGYEFCVLNDDNVSTVITFAAISGVQFENTARTSYKTANTSIVSGGAAGDKLCVLGRDSTHYLVASYVGTWS